MSATAALSGLASGAIALVCLLTIFPTARRLAGRLAGLPAQIVYISLAAVFSLCAVAVWASADVDGSSLEKHFKEQIMSVPMVSQLLEEMLPYNFSFEMGYSHGLEITAFLLIVAALAITILGLKKVKFATHPCCGKDKPLTVRQLICQSSYYQLSDLKSNNDEDGDDDFLAVGLGSSF